MVRKRKTLPKDFKDLLLSASLEELQAVFEKSEIDARGGYSKDTAIGFWDCPDALIVWLVEQGLDVDAANSYGRTPLYERASLGRVEQIPLLLSLGANIEAANTYGEGPLHAAVGGQKVDATRVLLDHGASTAVLDSSGRSIVMHGLARTRNASIAAMGEVAAMLLERGEEVTLEAQQEVERIGTDFEFHRSSFNPDYLDETEAGLARLYRLFDVAPVARHVAHDGVSPIIVPEGTWQQQHEALWDLLVPSSGAAQTVQGESIRVTGRLANEILGNGGVNWDRDFRRMLRSLNGYISQGNALSGGAQTEFAAIVSSLGPGVGDAEQLHRLSELAVEWVMNNPTPIPLAPLSYKR